jgi:YD repeat-containing protein
MKYQKLYYIPLSDAYKFSLLDDSLENPRKYEEKRKPYLFRYFDTAGNISKEIEYSEGRETTITTYVYTENKLQETRVDYLETGGSKLIRNIYTDNRVEVLEEMDGYLESRMVKIFDAEGRLQEQIEYGVDDTVLVRQVFDEHGEPVRLEYPGDDLSLFEYDYNEEGFLLCSREYSDGHILRNETRYTYRLGKLREKICRDGESVLNRTEYFYGADDKLKRTVLYDEQTEQQHEMEFDAAGAKVRETVTQDKQTVYNWERIDYPDLRGELYLKTELIQETYRLHGGLESSMHQNVSGKREVTRDQDGRPVEELLSNYDLSGDLQLMDGCYYYYEYGTE